MVQCVGNTSRASSNTAGEGLSTFVDATCSLQPKVVLVHVGFYERAILSSSGGDRILSWLGDFASRLFPLPEELVPLNDGD